MKLFGISISTGNAKLGEVWSFSLPSQSTCPGMSAWCQKHCYAQRYERRRPVCQNAYEVNLEFSQDTAHFIKHMIGVLPMIMPSMRIHVSGDFYSVPYIEAWKEICSAFPNTQFWTYTRSWIVPELRAALEGLRNLPNVQLFASTDPGMDLPPPGWRRAFLEDDPRASGVMCLAQTGERDSCLSCGYCYRMAKGDVVFRRH